MTNPKVSIIVPIYNVEKYLKRCVDSILNQTLKDIEIILVDDDSPDSCPQMCDTYAERDVRIEVIHKNNGGLSDARNAGLRKASGEYILFVDSDDYIDYDACRSFYMIAIKYNLDIVIGDAIRKEHNLEKDIVHSKKSLNILLDGPNFLKEQLQQESMHMAVWLSMYNRDFLINNSLFFKKGIYHEDEQWTPQVFLKAKKVQYIRMPFYYYIIRENSITKRKNKTKNGIDLINTCYELEEIYASLNDKELKDLLNNYLIMLFLNAIHIGELYNNKYKAIYSKKFLIGKATTAKNKLKVSLFILNKFLYKYTNKIEKSFKKNAVETKYRDT